MVQKSGRENQLRLAVEIPLFTGFIYIPSGAGFLNHQTVCKYEDTGNYQHVPFRNSVDRNDRMKLDISGRIK